MGYDQVITISRDLRSVAISDQVWAQAQEYNDENNSHGSVRGPVSPPLENPRLRSRPKEELNDIGRADDDWCEVNEDWVDGDPGAVE